MSGANITGGLANAKAFGGKGDACQRRRLEKDKKWR